MFENTSDPMPKTLSPWWWPKHHLFRQARKIMENSMEDSWKKHGKSWENLMTSLFFSEFLCSHDIVFQKAVSSWHHLHSEDLVTIVRSCPQKNVWVASKKNIKISVKQTLIIIIKHKVFYSTGSPPKKRHPKILQTPAISVQRRLGCALGAGCPCLENVRGHQTSKDGRSGGNLGQWTSRIWGLPKWSDWDLEGFI